MATNDFSNSSASPGLPARSGFQSQSYYNSSQNRPQGNRNNFRTPSPYPRPRSSASKPNHNASFSPKYQNSYNSYNMPNPGMFNSPKFQNADFPSSPNYFMPECNQSYGNYTAIESYEAKDMKQLYNNENDFYQCSDSDTSYNTCTDSSFQSPITPNAARDNFANRDFHDVRGQQSLRGGRNFMRSNKFTNYPAAANNNNKWSPAPTASKRPAVAASNQPTVISDPYVPQMQQALKSTRNGGYRPPVYYSTDDPDPVPQAVEDNITESTPAKKPKVVLRCELCALDFTSQIPLDMHLSGAKHAKKLKSEEILKALQTQGQAVQAQDKSKILHCEICNIMANSSQQLQMHLEGTKHKNRCRKLRVDADSLTNTGETTDEPQQNGGGDGDGDGDASQPLSSDPDQPKPAKAGRFYCETCSVTLNSELQLQQHVGSKKHQAKVEGKPLPLKKWWKKKKNQTENSANSTDDANSTQEEVTQEESNSTVPLNENASETPQTVYGVQAVEETFVKGEVMQ